MIARLRLFLLLWLPETVLLLAGLPTLMRTGQVDPAGWTWPAAVVGPVAGWLAARRGWLIAVWLTVGAVVPLMLFWRIAGGGWPDWPASAILVACLLLSIASGLLARNLLLRRQGHGMFFAVLVLVPAAVSIGRPASITPAPDRPRLAVLTALPLFWREGDGGPAARADAPIVTVLRQRFDVRPIDSPIHPGFAQMRLLLLAQPRALRPEELVAIDRWVRDGGRAVVLADPLLRWPSALPVGDRRRPPAVTLLSGLLDHWRLAVNPLVSLDERRLFVDGDRLVTVLAASTVRPLDAPCRAFAAGLGARCAVGRGEAIVIADADFIDDRLWLADSRRPLDPAQWVADSPRLLVRWLGADLPAGPRWVRDRDSLISGLRWAFLAGLGWAILGMLARTHGFRGLARPPDPSSVQGRTREH